MLQTHFLQLYAPNSLVLLYRTPDTGNPGHDISEHLAHFPSRRIDLQETQLVGGRVIGRVEQALGPADDNELQHKILTIPYAENRLGSNADAVEFVRVIKECAGNDADPRALQIWTSNSYDELDRLLSEYDPTSKLSVEEHRQAVVAQLLSTLGRTAMQLTAVTATNEEHLAEEPEVYEFYGPAHCHTDGDTENERRNLIDLRYKEVLYKHDITDLFTAELQHITAKLCRGGSSMNRNSETAVYENHLREDCGIDEDAIELIVEDFERVTEQYTENGATSLHMSDGDRFIVEGTIEEDIDASYLPAKLTELAGDIRELFIDGTPLSSEDEEAFTINSFISRQLDIIYGSRGDETARTTRSVCATIYLPIELKKLLPEIQRLLESGSLLSTIHEFLNQQIRSLFDNDRQILQYTQLLRSMIPAIRRGAYMVDNTGLIEYQQTTSAYREADERRYVEEVLAQIIQNMSRDFITSSRRRSPLFRQYFSAVTASTDTRDLKQTIRAAYEARKTNRLTIKMFTALNTLYQARCATLESAPLKQSDGPKTKVLAQPWLRLIKTIDAPELRTLTTGIQALPLQEKERIRTFLSANRPRLYNNIKLGLTEIVQQASARKLSYLRFAFFEDSKTGAPNKPDDMFHLLLKEDRAEIWELLKLRSRLPIPVAA